MGYVYAGVPSWLIPIISPVPAVVFLVLPTSTGQVYQKQVGDPVSSINWDLQKSLESHDIPQELRDRLDKCWGFTLRPTVNQLGKPGAPRISRVGFWEKTRDVCLAQGGTGITHATEPTAHWLNKVCKNWTSPKMDWEGGVGGEKLNRLRATNECLNFVKAVGQGRENYQSVGK